ncbi:MAG: plasmid stabilization protein [Ignavibacteriae bacterium]|nr:plasmid stabilization protein [Ignavibacteriota bacterium]
MDRKKYKVNLVKSAEDDLVEIYEYIFINDSEETADRIYLKLEEKILSLQNYPNRGHVSEEMNLLGIDDFLEINYKPYRIIYQVIKDTIFVRCVLDGRRDLQSLLQERLMRE